MEKADKRTEILRAAEQLFAEFGYEGTSTRQISKESGANMAMINYYFGSKEGVFLEIMESRISGFKTQLNQIAEEKITAKDKLLKVVSVYASRIFSNVCFHKMMHRELLQTQRPEIFTQVKEAMAQNLEVIESIINNGIKEGSFRKVDVRMLIVSVMGTINMVATSPSKVISDPNFDIKNDTDRDQLRVRLINHLNDLLLTHLIKH
ncbi:MAG: TetR/AcrR family transcriptional regulator [Pedobacter sp.]|nr:TetR/AcrR family transcriptional regulator [Pedobacter sp.]